MEKYHLKKRREEKKGGRFKYQEDGSFPDGARQMAVYR